MELLLDHFQVEACYLQEQAILAMYSYSAISGIVGEVTSILAVFQSKCNEEELAINTNVFFPFSVDIGDHIDIFPVVEGNKSLKSFLF